MNSIQQNGMGRIKRIHFVGVGGVGMAGIAEVMHNLGFDISGSDVNKEAATIKRLQSLGVSVHFSHQPNNISDVDVIVVSSAITNSNPEIVAAREARIPVIPRAEMLAELMRFHYGIAVAGTHGKTTTTSLITSILDQADLDPTFVIGGLLNSVGCNSHLGKSRYFVAEADESDASFLYIKPMLAVVTNIDADHMETYGGEMAQLRAAFVKFIQQLPFYGLAVLCVDDSNVREIIPRLSRPIITYGFSEEADVRIVEYEQQGLKTSFTVAFTNSERENLKVVLNLPGKYNALNATASIAIASELDIDAAHIKSALGKFSGIGRRMQLLGELQCDNGNVTLIDDYGHHPSEVSATIEALRAAWPGRRVVMTYQPHRYTRTRDCFNDFVSVLSTVDHLVLLDVYSAGEAVIHGADSGHLAKEIGKLNKNLVSHIEDVTQLPQTLRSTLQDGDILMMQGAGNIGQIAIRLAKEGLC